MATTSEAVLLHIAHVKFKKDDGVLYVMGERLAWFPGDKDEATLSHKYTDIKNQKISPEGKSKIQLQIVLYDNSTFNFHFVNPEGLQAQLGDRDRVKELLIELLPKFRVLVSRELEDKTRMLNENPRLFQLYRDLVGEHIVTAEQFWTSHAPQFLAANQQNPVTVKLEKGVPSGFLSAIKPEASGMYGEIHYNLSTDVIESIFKTYPAVRKKHDEYVRTSQMTEHEFWSMFFQSHYFHRDRLPVAKDMFSDCAKVDDKEMRRELEKIKAVGKDVMDTLEDSEKANVELVEPVNKAKDVLKSMIHRLNHHSIMILKAGERKAEEAQAAMATPAHAVVKVEPEPGTSSDGKKKKKKRKDQVAVLEEHVKMEPLEPPAVKKAKIAERIAFEDLKSEDDGSSYARLNLVVDRYLNGPIPAYKTEASFLTVEQLQQSVGAVREMARHWELKSRLLDSVTAAKILHLELQPGGSLMVGSYLNSGGSVRVSKEVQQELYNMYSSFSELLRAFWSCFPITTPELEVRAKSSYETLKLFEKNKIPQMKEYLSRNHMETMKMLAHVNSVIAAVDTKYSQWVLRKNKK